MISNTFDSSAATLTTSVSENCPTASIKVTTGRDGVVDPVVRFRVSEAHLKSQPNVPAGP
jgi:hypothetical protein